MQQSFFVPRNNSSHFYHIKLYKLFDQCFIDTYCNSCDRNPFDVSEWRSSPKTKSALKKFRKVIWFACSIYHLKCQTEKPKEPTVSLFTTLTLQKSSKWRKNTKTSFLRTTTPTSLTPYFALLLLHNAVDSPKKCNFLVCHNETRLKNVFGE